MERTIFFSIISIYLSNSIRTHFHFFSTNICACWFSFTSIKSTSIIVRLAYSIITFFLSYKVLRMDNFLDTHGKDNLGE
jgi:hypothetical protein